METSSHFLEVNMGIRKIGNRGLLFTYDDLGIPTNIYVIVTENKYFIIDTYLGEDIVREIDRYLKDNYGIKENIVINTHSDWDHIWGNSYFANDTIIAHRYCREDIIKNGEYYLEKYSEYKRGFKYLALPNIIFEEKIIFPEEHIEIFYSKGHSLDSISIYDSEERILYGGDNIEKPIPHIQSKDIKSYIETLDNYLKMEIDIVLGGHILVEDKSIIVENKLYLENIYNVIDMQIIDGKYSEIHDNNMKFLNKR